MRLSRISGFVRVVHLLQRVVLPGLSTCSNGGFLIGGPLAKKEVLGGVVRGLAGGGAGGGVQGVGQVAVERLGVLLRSAPARPAGAVGGARDAAARALSRKWVANEIGSV